MQRRMMTVPPAPSLRFALTLAAIAALVVGCEGPTVPRQVHAGTTFFLPYGSYEGFSAFGEADVQRGEIVFFLCPWGQFTCDPDHPQEPSGHELTTTYMTRVFPDRGSEAAIRGYLEIHGEEFTWPLLGQPVAFVDVPETVPEAWYWIVAKRRQGGSLVPGWSVALTYIYVLPPCVWGSECATPAEAYLNGHPYLGGHVFDATQDLKDLVPYPQLILTLEVEPFEGVPAAAEIVLSYPQQDVSIKTAFEHADLGTSSMVRWSPGPGSDEVTIRVIDPDQRVKQLAVAFELTATEPVQASDFVVESATAYDLEGNEIDAASPAFSIESIL